MKAGDTKWRQYSSFLIQGLKATEAGEPPEGATCHYKTKQDMQAVPLQVTTRAVGAKVKGCHGGGSICPNQVRTGRQVCFFMGCVKQKTSKPLLYSWSSPEPQEHSHNKEPKAEMFPTACGMCGSSPLNLREAPSY